MGRWSPLLYAKRSSLPSPLQPPFPTLHPPSQLPLSLLQVLHIILIHHAIPSQPSDSYRYIYFHPCSTSSLNKELFFHQLLYPESTEWFTESQAFSRSYDSTPCSISVMPTPLISLSRQYAWPATHRKTENERNFADGKGGGGQEPNHKTARKLGPL